MTRPPDEIDGCSCHKAPGMWGSGGWHFLTIDANFVMRKIRDYEALERQNPGGGESRGGIFSSWAHLAEHWQANGEKFIGTDLAWERCPAYQAAVRGRIASKQAGANASPRRYD